MTEKEKHVRRIEDSSAIADMDILDDIVETIYNQLIKDKVQLNELDIKTTGFSIKHAEDERYCQHILYITMRCQNKFTNLGEIRISHKMHRMLDISTADMLGILCRMLNSYVLKKVSPPTPSWIEFYIGLAVAVGKKSKDSTKHGCVITDSKNKILGFGFNGYPEGFPDYEMPRHRDASLEMVPNKYDVTPHAEINAATNCQHKPEGGIAYIDGIACGPCLIHLYQNGIRKVFMLDRTSVMLDERTQKVSDFIVEKSQRSQYGPLETFVVKPSLQWLVDIGEEIKNGVY